MRLFVLQALLSHRLPFLPDPHLWTPVFVVSVRIVAQDDLICVALEVEHLDLQLLYLRTRPMQAKCAPSGREVAWESALVQLDRFLRHWVRCHHREDVFLRSFASFPFQHYIFNQ